MNNVGKIDRLIRMLLAVGLIILHITHVIPKGYEDIALFAAAILAMTSLRKCCPLYSLLGFGTCGVNHNKQEPRIKTKKLDI